VLSLSVQAHAAYVEMKKIPMMLVEQYQRGGVDATLRVLEGTNWSENLNNGTFEASCGWQSCGSINEPWATLDQYSNRTLSRSASALEPTTGATTTRSTRTGAQAGLAGPGRPEVTPPSRRRWTFLIDEMPVIWVTQARKILPFLVTYWKNFPTAKENPLSPNYCHPPAWWSIVHFILQNVQKA